MNLKDLKTRTKLVASFSIVVFLTAIIAAVGIRSLTDVNLKQNNLGEIKDTKSDMLTARLYMRTFMHLRDSQYFQIAKASVDTAITIVESLKPRITIKENIDLVNQYSNELSNYRSLMVENYNAVLEQVNSINLRAKIRKQVIVEFDKSGLPENHKMNYYFTNARLSGTYIYALSKPELYPETKKYIELAIKESENAHLYGVTPLLKTFDQAMDNFMTAYSKSKETEEKLLEKGKEISKIEDHFEENTDDYVKIAYRNAIIFTVLFTLVAILISLLITYVLTKYMVTMIKKGGALARVYAEGNLAFVVPAEDLKLKDELGDLTRSMVMMGDKLKEIIGGVLESARNVADASNQISSASQQISQGASEQASSVEEVSSSMEQMTSNIQQNTDNAQQTEKIAQSAANGITTASEKAQKAVEANRIIAEKIIIINDIAFQTNILALNAAVEAARAGEQGRGFAVVASEVRKLAERSKIAADEIVSLSRTSLDLVEGTGIKMQEIMPEIERTSNLVKEITSASIEQNSGSEQISNALQQLNNVTQQNAAASEELATNAEEMTAQAEMMKEQVSYFKIGTDYQHKTKFAGGFKRTSASQGPKKELTKKTSAAKGVTIKLNDADDDQFTHF
jgi:methyl-accepting chemotaxis protein